MNAANRATYPVKEGSMRLWVHLETWGASLICNCNKPTIRSKHSFRRTVRVDLSVQSPKVIQYFRNQTWEYASLRIFGLSVTHFMFHLRSVQKLCWLVICSGIITSTTKYIGDNHWGFHPSKTGPIVFFFIASIASFYESAWESAESSALHGDDSTSTEGAARSSFQAVPPEAPGWTPQLPDVLGNMQTSRIYHSIISIIMKK